MVQTMTMQKPPRYSDDEPESNSVDWNAEIDAPTGLTIYLVITLCLAALALGFWVQECKADSQVAGQYVGTAQFSDAPASRILLDFPIGRVGFQGVGTIRLIDRCHTHDMKFNQSAPRTLVMTSSEDMERHNAGFSCVARYSTSRGTIAGNCMWKVPGDQSPYGSRFAFIAGLAPDYDPPPLPDHCDDDENPED